MAYALLTDLLAQITTDELGRLCDDSGQGLFFASDDHDEEQTAAATAARAVAEEALEASSAKADGYFGVWKTVPLDSPPKFVQRLVVDLALYELYVRRNLSGMNEGRQSKYDNAIRMLEQIAAGKLSLGAAPEAPLHQPGRIVGAKDDEDRLFSSTSLTGY